MEFNEKLQKLRTNENLTQEELAEKLYVSRTAISKWESGRGYPSIDSLKAIAKYFHVTIDELIGGEEIVTLAEQDIKESNKKYTTLLCGILDCLRACLESRRVRTAPSDFSPDEGNSPPPYCRIARRIHEIWRKRCKQDVREGILNRLLWCCYCFYPYLATEEQKR